MKENRNLTTKEIEKIVKIAREKSSVSNSTLYIHDIENTIGQNKHELKKSKKINDCRSLLSEIDKKLNVESSDLAIISANYNLLQFINKLYYQKTPCEEILIPAKGKDAADIKLVETIQLLQESEIIEMYKNVVIISGDKKFYSPTKNLIEKGLNVETYSRSPESTSSRIKTINNHRYVSNFKKTKPNNVVKKKKKKKISISSEDKFLYSFQRLSA